MEKTRRKGSSIFFKILFVVIGTTIASNLVLASVLYKGYSGILDQIRPFLDVEKFRNIEVNITNTWIVVGASLVPIFIIAALFAIILSSKLVEPIRKLVKALRETAKGNLNVRVKVATRDEIEELADALNDMIAKVREARKILEDERAILEIRVRARTYQLKEQAERLREENLRKTKEIRERLEELEKFHKLTVGRELRMIELKKEIARLKQEIENLKNNQKSK